MAQLGVRKHINLFGLKVKYSFMNMSEYRSSILVWSIGTYGYMIITLLFLNILISEFTTIGGWNQEEMLALFVTGQIIFYTFTALFFYLSSGFSEEVEKGDLDKFITKPINLLFNVSFQKLQIIESIPGIVFVSFVAVFAYSRLPSYSAADILIYILSVTISIAIFYLVALSIGLLSFWLTDTNGLNMLFFRAYSDYNKFPATIFPDFLKLVLYTLLPIALLAYAPTEFLINGFSIKLFTIQIITLLMFIGIASFLWSAGFKRYSSASS